MSGSSDRELDLFSAVRQLRGEERAAFLDRACAGDALLRRRIEELLKAQGEAGAFMENAAPGVSISALGSVVQAEKAGDRIGRYKLLEQIGEGGCGVVYMAEQEEPVRRKVALKVIKLGMDTKSVIARFEAERQALALMDHPNIAKVLDAGTTPTGRPYFVMELVRGLKITDFCDNKHLSIHGRLNIFIAVCQAIQHAHQKGIIHRDIKPSNILVTVNDGIAVPKVIDFGIAKATQGRLTDKTLFTAFEQFIGTPAYMSPEQTAMTSLDIDTRSDIYSLGVLLYELLAGTTPFETEKLLRAGLDEIRRIIREEEPARPSTKLSTMNAGEFATVSTRRGTEPPRLMHILSGDLDWIAIKCLEKDRRRRYETATDLAADIQRYLSNEPVLACPPSYAYRLHKMVRRNKLIFAASSAIILSLVVGFGISLRLFVKERESQRQADVARRQAEADAARADAAATEARRTLAASDFSEALRLIAADDGPDAVCYLSRILSTDPNNKAALTQLAMLLSYRSWMLPTFRLKHDGPVNSAQFSPDGNYIVTASRDNTARVWDAKTGRPVTGLLGHKGIVNSAQFSPDSKHIVTASADNTARIWDAQTGRETIEALQLGSAVTYAEFSPDGRHIVTGTYKGSAQIWDVETGKPAAPPMKHGSEVRSVRFSPDGKRIVTASSDRTARIWDSRTGQELAQPLKHKSWMTSARFSPDSKRVVTSGEDNTVRIWDAQTGRALTQPLKEGEIARDAEFSPDGTRIVTASQDNSARVWDASTGLPLTELLRHRNGVGSAQFSPDGRQIVTASRDNTAQVWDAQTGKRLMEPLQHGGCVNRAQFSPDGRRIVTASDDNTACVWDERTGRLLTEPLNHEDEVDYAEFSPDGRVIATASSDHTARLWDVRSGRQMTTPLKHKSRVIGARFSLDGKRIVTASEDGTARVWDVRTGQPLTCPLIHHDWVDYAEFSPDGKWIVTASHDRTARVWEAETGEALISPIEHQERVNSARFSPDGTRIVTACYDGTARVWDARSGEPVTPSLVQGNRVFSAQFSPNGKQIVTVSENRSVQVWDAQTGQTLLGPLEHRDAVIFACFSPDGRYILSASHDNTARLWDARTGLPPVPPLKHEGWLCEGEFSPDGTQVVTASYDQSARVWDALTGLPLTQPLKHQGRVHSARFSPDGRRVVTASSDHSAQVWDVGLPISRCPDWLLPLAEALSGVRLNKEGTTEPTSLDRAKTIERIRQDLDAQSDAGDGVIWGRWLLADPFRRPISPWSSITLRTYIENRITRETKASLDEAEELALGHSELLERIADGRQALAKMEPIITKRELAQSYSEAGRWDDVVKLREELLALCHELNRPEDETCRAIRELAISYSRAGYEDKAIKSRENLLALYRKILGPEDPDVHDLILTLAKSYDKAGRHEECSKLWEELLANHRKAFGQKSPMTLYAMTKLAESYHKTGRRDECIRLQEDIASNLLKLAARGQYAAALNDFAWTLATSDAAEMRNGTNAVRLAEKAVAATHRKNAGMLDTLAAAFAETGHFDKAVAAQKEGINLLKADADIKDFESRLKIYEAGKPYRQQLAGMKVE